MPELSQADQLKQKIGELQEQLLAAHPQMPTLLRTIHKQLLEDNSLVQTLTEEEIGVIVSGLKKQTGIHITTKASKASTTSLKKKHANLTVDDL